MSNRSGVLVGGILVVVVIAVGIVAAANTRRPGGAPDALPEPSVAASIGTASSGTPGIATASPTAASETSPGASASTPQPRSTGDPRHAYAEFLTRTHEDRTTVADLNTTLQAAIENKDRDATRAASVDILDFVDSDRDWLRDHPPAECYVDAHDAANAMLTAYGTAADGFIAWSNAPIGLDSLAAFTSALEAVNAANDALVAFDGRLGITTCP
jgi:hypothetical protein